MKIATMTWAGRSADSSSAICRRSSTKRQILLERLEDRLALSGLFHGGFSISDASDLTHGGTNKGAASILSHGAKRTVALDIIGAGLNDSLTTRQAKGQSTFKGGFNRRTGVATSDLSRISLASDQTGLTITAGDSPTQYATENVLFTGPSVWAYITPQGLSLDAYTYSAASNGTAIMTAGTGVYTYQPGVNFTGPDSFTYYVDTTTFPSIMSSIGTIYINVAPAATVLPSTPFLDYLRQRRSIDPARFDFFHPKIGALIGLDVTGMPTLPTTIVSRNDHFNATAARSLHARSPVQYDQEQPVLGALFQLENPATAQMGLLPQTAYYKEQRALFDHNPVAYQMKNLYLGAIFAIEDLA